MILSQKSKDITNTKLHQSLKNRLNSLLGFLKEDQAISMGIIIFISSLKLQR